MSPADQQTKNINSRCATYQSRLSPTTLLSGLLGKVSKTHQKSWSGGNGGELPAVMLSTIFLMYVIKKTLSNLSRLSTGFVFSEKKSPHSFLANKHCFVWS